MRECKDPGEVRLPADADTAARINAFSVAGKAGRLVLDMNQGRVVAAELTEKWRVRGG